MARSNPNDINIGPDQWVQWVSFTERNEIPASIDPLILPMMDFWKRLETECVSACCGIDAFNLWPENIRIASQEAQIFDLQDQLNQLRSYVADSNSSVFNCGEFNQLFDRAVLLQLIDHVASHLANKS